MTFAGVRLQEMDECVGGVVDMQKFATWRPRAPDRHGLVAGKLCQMRFADYGRDHMAPFEIEIVARAI